MDSAMGRMHDFSGPVHGAGTFGAAVLLATAVTVSGFAISAPAATYEGAPAKIGDGLARAVVETDWAGTPTSIAVMLSREALQGLPPAPNPESPVGAWIYPLPMPNDGPKTGFRTVVIDWMPHGHPPPNVYTVPHFDFHFYALEAADLDEISFTGPDDPSAKVTDMELIPQGYQVVAETAVDKMGVHAIDTDGPEFHGKPFASTFIYGYYDGGLIFIEPMVTRDFLLTGPDFTAPVKAPAHVSLSGHYPTSYHIRYDAAGQTYSVALEGLRYRGQYLGTAQ